MRGRAADCVATGKADPAYVAAFTALVKRLQASVKEGSAEPIAMYVAGGAAMHFYTGSRISDDVDAAFGARLHFPGDAQVLYRDSEGNPRVLYLDPNYNETFALMHEDAHEDALRLPLPDIRGVHVYLLQPVDLALSKLSRFGEIDRADILQLAKHGLVTANALRRRAEEAMPRYVGDPAQVRIALDLACKDIAALPRQGGAARARRKRKP
jgi:hypothetical protein